MNQPLHVQHPYIEKALPNNDGFTVTLSQHFPIRSFSVWLDHDLWPGYIEVAGEVGIRNSDDEIDWLRGTGTSVEEAVEDLLIMLVNLVVHPEQIQKSDVVYRERAA